jgi:signal peptidase I
MPNKKRGFLYHAFDVALNVVVILAIVGAVRTFLVSPFQVEGSSMISTLHDREYIIINKLVYFLHAPKRGDVVVFHPPTDVSKYYVKRVVGEPGDTVRISDGYVSVKPAGQSAFVRLDESMYLSDFAYGHTYQSPPNSGNTQLIDYVVPSGNYFLLGDNRPGSLDSRSFIEGGVATPFVAKNSIKGKVWFVALPITKIHALTTPEFSLPGSVAPQP